VVQSSKDSATGVLVCSALHAPPSEILALYLKAPESDGIAQPHHQVSTRFAEASTFYQMMNGWQAVVGFLPGGNKQKLFLAFVRMCFGRQLAHACSLTGCCPQ
jgi:hypothetical protein